MKYTKMKKILITIIITLSILSLNGCMPKNYSDETRQRVDDEIVEKTNQWFSKNMPDATVVEAGMDEFNYGFLSYVTYGTYELDGNSYSFYYDTKKDQFYDSALYDETLDYINEAFGKAFGQSEYLRIEQINNVSFFYETVQLTESQKKENKGELLEEEALFAAMALPYEIKSKDIPSFVETELQKKYNSYLWFNVIYETGTDIEKIKLDDTGFSKYPDVRHVTIACENDPDYSGLLSITYGNEASQKERKVNYVVGEKFDDNLSARYFYSDTYYDQSITTNDGSKLEDSFASDSLRNGFIEFHTCDEKGNETKNGTCFYMTSSSKNCVIILKSDYTLYSFSTNESGTVSKDACRGDKWMNGDEYSSYDLIFSEKEDGSTVSRVYCYE